MRTFFLSCLCLCLSAAAAAQIFTDKDWERVITPASRTRQLQGEARFDKQPETYLELGKAYLTGSGVKKNTSKAKKYISKAAAKGLPEAQLLLATLPLYQPEEKTAPADWEKSFRQILQLAQDGYPPAQYEAAHWYAEGKGTPADPQASITWLQHAAEPPLPVPQAQTRLGQYYYDGYPPYLKRDVQKAFSLFLAAAEAEDKTACYQVAQMYLQGIGTEKNEKRAFKFMRDAARKKLVPAQMALSDMYRTGTGVKQDDYGAFKWMYEAARQGQVQAQEQTALHYLHGTGVAKDPAEAAFWARRAQQNGSQQAQDILRQLGL